MRLRGRTEQETTTPFVGSFHPDKEFEYNVFSVDASTVMDCATSFGSIELVVELKVLESNPPLDFTSYPDDIEYLRSTYALNNLSYPHEYRHRRIFSEDAPTEPARRLNNHSIIDTLASTVVDVVFDLEVNVDRSQVTVHCHRKENEKMTNVLWSCLASLEFICQTHPHMRSFQTEEWFNNVCPSITIDIPDKKAILTRNVNPVFQMTVVWKDVYPVKIGDASEPPSTTSDFGSMFLEEDLSDFYFRSGRHKIPSHKVILSERCSFFRECIQSSQETNNNNNGKRMNEVQLPVFMNIPFSLYPFLTFLRGLYCKEILVKDANDSLAEFLMICETFRHGSLIRVAFPLLSQSNALIFFNFRKHLTPAYIDRLWKVIDSCAKSILKSKYFLELTAKEIIELIDRDTFCAPEIMIYHSCLSWVEEECARNNKPSNDNESKRSYIQEIKKHIRFNLMTRDEFLMESSFKELLTDHEYKSILRLINATEDDPTGLSRFETRPRVQTQLFQLAAFHT
jgi:hypothetical protein